MWVNCWSYNNPVKVLRLNLCFCSSLTMWNHSIIGVRSLVGFNFARSLKVSRISQCFWDRPCVYTVPCSFSACLVLSPGLSKPTASLQISFILQVSKENSSYRHTSAICTLRCSDSPVFSFQTQCWPEEPQFTKSWCLPRKTPLLSSSELSWAFAFGHCVRQDPGPEAPLSSDPWWLALYDAVLYI